MGSLPVRAGRICHELATSIVLNREHVTIDFGAFQRPRYHAPVTCAPAETAAENAHRNPIMPESNQIQAWALTAQQGDHLALSKLLAALYPQLRARLEATMGPALRARTTPDDILQEAFLAVFRHIEGFEDRGPNAFMNWIYTILDSKLADAQRAAQRQVRGAAGQVAAGQGSTDSYWNLLEHVYADSGTPSRVVRREETLGALLACIADLPPAQHEVIQLRFLEGASVADVAARLGKTDAAIVALTQRGLQGLRESLARRGDVTWGP
jgi:RNA polymerase sigma-70 factor (ECF subfamily)